MLRSTVVRKVIKGLKLRIALALTLVTSFLLISPPGKTEEDTKKEPWDYVALGDSITAEYGVDEGYVTIYTKRLESDTGVTVDLTNLGQNGWTSGDLLYALRNDPSVRRVLRRAEIVTFHIGTNDLRKARIQYKRKKCGGADNQDCLRKATRELEVNWNAIFKKILRLRSSQNTIIRTMDLYNPYVGSDRVSDTWDKDGGLNDYRVFKRYVGDFNRYVAKQTTANEVPYGKAYRTYNGLRGSLDPAAKGYLLDRNHPNEKGHRVLARRLQVTGYEPLR